MSLELFVLILGLVVELIIGKLLQIPKLKIKSKLELLLPKLLILIVLFVIIPLVGHTMVFYSLILGLGQLRHGSNATGPSYGKRFKKEGVLGVCLNMNNGTLSFSLNG